MLAIVAPNEAAAAFMVPSTSPPYFGQYELIAGIPGGAGQSIGGNLVPLPISFGHITPSFSNDRFAGSAAAGYLLEHTPVSSQITGWTTARVNFYDFGLINTSSGLVNFNDLYFRVLPEPGELLGDPIIVYAHYSAVGLGSSGGISATAYVYRNTNLAASFSGYGAPSTVAINGAIGDQFSISIGLSSLATPVNPVIGSGPNTSAGLIAINFSPLDPPPPPSEFTLPNPVPEPTNLPIGSLVSIWIWRFLRKFRGR